VNPFKLIESYPKWPIQNVFSGYYKNQSRVLTDPAYKNYEPHYRDLPSYPPVGKKKKTKRSLIDLFFVSV